MGLDMYLYKKSCAIKRSDGTIVVSDERTSEDETTVYVEEEVCYWRKANHIHQWFVNNVQDENDDCKEYYVSKEQLEDLIRTCKEVLKIFDGKKFKTEQESQKEYIFDSNNPSEVKKWDDYWSFYPELTEEDLNKITELLPREDGFFFGSMEYNGDYLYDIVYTIQNLETILANCKGTESFYYQSSW